MRTAALGEVIVEADLLRRGLATARPTVVSRYDLVADDGKRMYRVQVKVGRWDMRGSTPALKASFSEPYFPEEVDVIALVDLDSSTVYYVPVEDLTPGTLGITIRFDKPRESSAFDATECLGWPWPIENETSKEEENGDQD